MTRRDEIIGGSFDFGNVILGQRCHPKLGGACHVLTQPGGRVVDVIGAFRAASLAG